MKIFVKSMILAAFYIAVSVETSHAQSFFATLVADPATGVDRGSASRIRAVDKPTGFVTFSSIGAKPIGPYIGSIGYSLPSFLLQADQIDAIAVVGGLSADGGLELAAGGVGYRLALGEGLPTVYANADYGGYELGTRELLPLEIRGTAGNATIGIRQAWRLDGINALTGSLEFSGRRERAAILGNEVVAEDLRLARLAVLHSYGAPGGFQSRLGLSLTKGTSGFGASPVKNLKSSAPGVSSEFFRIAASAEASVPLPGRFLLNAGMIGQWSDDSLPLSQRCGYGSNNYARGFDQGYVNGDSCFGGRIELAYDIQRPAPGDRIFRSTQAFAGIDHGHIWDNANAFAPTSHDRWSSASLGLRALHGNFLGEIALTQILTLPPGAAHQSHTRVWFQGAMQF